MHYASPKPEFAETRRAADGLDEDSCETAMLREMGDAFEVSGELVKDKYRWSRAASSSGISDGVSCIPVSTPACAA